MTQPEVQFRVMIDEIPTLAWSCHPDGATEFLNQQWLDYTGLAMAEALGWGWAAAVHPDDLEKLMAVWQGLVASGQSGEGEARLRRHDGAYRWFLFRTVPVRDERGHILRWFGTNTEIEALKQAEDVLRQSEDRFRLLVDATPALIHTAQPDGYIDFLNQGWLDYAGRAEEELRGWGWISAFHPDDIEECVSKWRAALASGEPFEGQGRVRRADGEYRMLLHHKVPLRDQQGNITKWYGSSIDIEELKRTEAHLKESEERFRRMADTMMEVIWIMDLNPEQVLYISPSFERVWGWRVADLYSNPRLWRDAIHPEDRERVAESFKEWMAGREVICHDIEYRITQPNGEVRWVHERGVASFNEQGRPYRISGISTDITDRVQAQEVIRRNERELREIIDAIPQLITVLSRDGKITYVNQPVLEFTGLSQDEVGAGAIVQRVLHPDDWEHLQEVVEASISRGAPFEIEQRLRRKDGRYRWFLNWFKPLLDDEANIIRWYVTGVDIDDRKQTEERIENENLTLREEIDRSSMFEEIVGSSEPLRQVLSQVTRVAPTDSTVLILGQTGTGKELIARAIHKRSNRASRAFISVNCAAIPSTLIASELFGHERGAFTGAMKRRLGRFESANGGTIFLDEVGELPPETQIALLRVLQEREVERVGGCQPITVDVRVIAATNKDLKAAVLAGTFREDLFYRLNVFPIQIPLLRERVDDIPLLAEYLVDRYAKKTGKNIKKIEKRTLDLFRAYAWPGNVREMQNVIERAVILCDGDTFSVDETWLADESTQGAGLSRAPKPQTLRLSEDEEREMIEAALAESKGQVGGKSGAAVRLGIPRQTLESKIVSLGINKHRFKPA